MDVDEEYPAYNRSLQDIKTIIKHAKLDEKSLTGLTQTLYFSPQFHEHDKLKLLELNPDLLACIENNKKLCFKGGLNEKIVLCSEEKTYEVKEAEISNSLVLIEGLKFGQQTSRSPLKSPKSSTNNSMNSSVEDEPDDDIELERDMKSIYVTRVFHDYYECREIKPRYRKMYDLLQVTRYSGPENEYTIDSNLLFTFDQLLNTTQCSEKEFHAGLELYRAFEIDGHMRVLDYEYEYRVISLMLGLISENSWLLGQIDRDVTLESLKEIVPQEIIENLFDLYTQPSVEYSGKFAYKQDMVCRIVAQNILAQGQKFHVDEFFTTWQDAVPELFHPKEAHLRGIGIIDRESRPQCIRSLNEINLPMDLNDRLRILFKTKAKWTLEEIEPYIEVFATNLAPVTGILTKFTRVMTVNGKRIFVAKH